MPTQNRLKGSQLAAMFVAVLINYCLSNIIVDGYVLDTLQRGVSGATVTIANTPFYTLSGTSGFFVIDQSSAVLAQIPRNPLLRISFYNDRFIVSNADGVNLSVALYNLKGRLLFSARPATGRFMFPKRLSSGVYIIKISSGGVNLTKKMVFTENLSSRDDFIVPVFCKPNDNLSKSSGYRFISAEKELLTSDLIPLSGDTVTGLNIILKNNRGNFAPADYVDPFICTAVDFGQLSPAATVPWGVVKLGPETSPGSHAGYDYNAEWLKGFSHIRLPGVGGWGAGGSILIKPGIDQIYSIVPLDKASEHAGAGYYEVTFSDPPVRAELTASRQTGFHRYTFPASENAFIYMDLAYNYNANTFMPDFTVSDDMNEITGRSSGTHNGNQGSYNLYFSALFNKQFESVITDSIGLVVTFSTDPAEKVMIKVGISPISVEQARLERESEIPGWNFDSVKIAAKAAWNGVLGKVSVSGNENFKKLFYTHLYNSYMLPMETTSSSGQYMGVDGTVYSASRPHYNAWSIWDTFRTKFPLLSITEPARFQDMVQSLVDLYSETQIHSGGWNEPVPTTRTDQMLGVISDAYLKGLRDFDFNTAWQKMVDDVNGHIFERSWNCWCLARMAEELEKPVDYDYYIARAQDWKSVWTDNFKDVMHDSSADSIGSSGLYEGTKWQYRWLIPHDIQGVINIMGGRQKFIEELEYFFENDLYNHGNQPDIQAAYLFDFGGAPWLSQRWVRKILTKQMVQRYGTHNLFSTPYYGYVYKTTADGYIPEMDDDAGTMAAWFVLGAMGIYQACVGEPVFEIGTPIFEEVAIRLDENLFGGETFRIIANNVSEENYYIQSATLNGEPLNRPWIYYSEIVSGGELVFEMGAEPNVEWGAAVDAAPPSMSPP